MKGSPDLGQAVSFTEIFLLQQAKPILKLIVVSLRIELACWIWKI